MADIKLDSFKNQLKDTCRPNRFWVTIVGNSTTAWEEQPFSFMVKSFVLPDKTIGEITLNYQGMQSKMAGDITFSDVTMTVHVDDAMKIKQYFEDLMEEIIFVGTEGENTRTLANEYKAEIIVEQLGRTGNPVATYHLLGAWPKNMNSIELSHDSTDTPMDMQIDFAIDMWYREG